MIDWTERQVWGITERHRVRPHPSYQLGFGRTSCIACIFSDENQWGSVKSIAPARFERIAGLEREFRTTIKKGQTVEDMARKGKEFVSDKSEELRRLAMSPDAFTAEQFFLTEGEVWKALLGHTSDARVRHNLRLGIDPSVS